MATTQILNMNYAIWHKTSFATISLQQILVVFLNVASFLTANLSTWFPVFKAIYGKNMASILLVKEYLNWQYVRPRPIFSTLLTLVKHTVAKNNLLIPSTPVPVLFWCSTTKMLISHQSKGACLNCCTAVFRASPEHFNILMYQSKNSYFLWVNPEMKVFNGDILPIVSRALHTLPGILYIQCPWLYWVKQYIYHQDVHLDCSAPGGKQHAIQTGILGNFSTL